MIATYTIVHGGFAIRCELCGSVSALPDDVHHRYCGRCHLWHAAIAIARSMHADGAAHDCGEWRTARNACAVCGRQIAARPPTDRDQEWADWTPDGIDRLVNAIRGGPVPRRRRRKPS